MGVIVCLAAVAIVYGVQSAVVSTISATGLRMAAAPACDKEIDAGPKAREECIHDPQSVMDTLTPHDRQKALADDRLAWRAADVVISVSITVALQSVSWCMWLLRQVCFTEPHDLLFEAHGRQHRSIALLSSVAAVSRVLPKAADWPEAGYDTRLALLVYVLCALAMAGFCAVQERRLRRCLLRCTILEKPAARKLVLDQLSAAANLEQLRQQHGELKAAAEVLCNAVLGGSPASLEHASPLDGHPPLCPCGCREQSHRRVVHLQQFRAAFELLQTMRSDTNAA